MEITLDEKHQQFVDEKLASGEFSSASELIQVALDRFQDEMDDSWHEYATEAVTEGLAELDRGERIPATEAWQRMQASRQARR